MGLRLQALGFRIVGVWVCVWLRSGLEGGDLGFR